MAKRQILVVDDEIDFLEMIRLRLEANDYTVITAMDGNEALEKLKAEKPSAVLLDILMPGMDGLSVLKKIRKENEHIPVFIITAFSTDERFEEARKLGASGFIAKTGDMKREIERITSMMNIAKEYRGS